MASRKGSTRQCSQMVWQRLLPSRPSYAGGSAAVFGGVRQAATSTSRPLASPHNHLCQPHPLLFFTRSTVPPSASLTGSSCNDRGTVMVITTRPSFRGYAIMSRYKKKGGASQGKAEISSPPHPLLAERQGPPAPSFQSELPLYLRDRGHNTPQAEAKHKGEGGDKSTNNAVEEGQAPAPTTTADGQPPPVQTASSSPKQGTLPPRRRLVMTTGPPPPLEAQLKEVPLFFEQPAEPRLCEIALLGPPNAGKSTLVNAIVGEKVSPVCRKAQTTRQRTLGITTVDNTQLVFLDTPGVVSPNLSKRYGRSITTTGWDVAEKADVVLVLVDIARQVDSAALFILNKLAASRQNFKSKEIVLVLNKMDLLSNANLLKERVAVLTKPLNDQQLFERVFRISALKGVGVDTLKSFLVSKASPRDWTYPKDWKTNMSDVERVTEVIREKIYNRTNAEVPYLVEQENVGWRTNSKGELIIHQNIIVPRPNQKKLMVGKAGNAIKRIYLRAKLELQEIFNTKVHLFLQVKSKKK
ncbi:tRNA modification GTPase TrmE [Balamuthia mandrillaris]